MRIEDICSILELPVSSYGLDERMSKDEADKALQDFKDLVKKQWRVLAKKYHPDLPSSGEAELARMQEINATIDIIMKLKITKIAQKPRPQNVQFHFTSQNPFGDNSTTSGTYGGRFSGFTFYRY